MIIRTIDPVVAYCMQICIHVQFYWGGTCNNVHLTEYWITAVTFFVYIGKSWTVLGLKIENISMHAFMCDLNLN